MNAHDHSGKLTTPQALDDDFKRRARRTNGDAAARLLAGGRAVSYREKDTPAGHVLRKHPDGRIEIVKIDLGIGKTGAARRSA
jgi:hypothetical protein